MTGVLEKAKGLGPIRKKALEAAGILSDERLLAFFPVRYTDYTNVKTVADSSPGEEIVLEVGISGKPSQARVNGKTITRAVLRDETGSIQAVWFSQPWMYERLSHAEKLTVYGRAEWRKGKLYLTGPRIVTEKCLTPFYKPLPGLPEKLLKEWIREALDSEEAGRETLPVSVLREFELPARPIALKQIHCPDNRPALENALRRFSFENTLYFMLSALQLKRTDGSGIQIRADAGVQEMFAAALQFPLTGAQRRVLSEIIDDMKSEKAMARLVQGDVGCGKTAVAFGAIYAAVCSGYQCAMMAPTEILAGQHFESAQKILGPLGVRCGLLTGSMTGTEKKCALKNIGDGTWQAVFGTHALISPGVKYSELGLVITDEQHRFGVRQRTRLEEKGERPNVLVMSATPIPRTLSLILYGDLDISVIDELPAGRKPVSTRIVPPEKRDAMYGFIASELEKGRQAYFVCPLVEESETVEAEDVQSVYEQVRGSVLGPYGVRLVNGRMSAEEKEAALADFKNGTARVLVSTTVIEVGINVPTATVMVVENAERFGLAQLHQLRGRVGRGSEEAWCFLMAKPTQKLKILTQTNDGFVIARRDMELRGPGDMFGTRQSGAPAGLDADSVGDLHMLEEVHRLAKQMTTEDSEDARLLKNNAQKWLQGKTDVFFAQN